MIESREDAAVMKGRQLIPGADEKIIADLV